MSQTHSRTHSLTMLRLILSTIYPLLVDRFGRPLRFCHREFDKEAVSDLMVRVSPLTLFYTLGIDVF